jgi:hypothetical protein
LLVPTLTASQFSQLVHNCNVTCLPPTYAAWLAEVSEIEAMAAADGREISHISLHADDLEEYARKQEWTWVDEARLMKFVRALARRLSPKARAAKTQHAKDRNRRRRVALLR